MTLPWSWNATTAELAAAYPCDEYAPPGARRCVRAVDVTAASAVVFRWLCQLRAAPYSYDLVDNLGRRSPRTLTPGLEHLAVDQQFMTIFRLVDFAVDDHLTMVLLPRPARVFGPLAMTYAIRPQGGGSRLVVAMAVGASGPFGGVRRTALAWGDVVMMRKQLLTLRDLAEATVRAA